MQEVRDFEEYVVQPGERDCVKEEREMKDDKEKRMPEDVNVEEPKAEDEDFDYLKFMEEHPEMMAEKVLIIRESRRREPVQRTIKDIIELNMPEESPLEAEWSDGNGYHRAPVTGAWESENGAVVLSVGKDAFAAECDE